MRAKRRQAKIGEDEQIFASSSPISEDRRRWANLRPESNKINGLWLGEDRRRWAKMGKSSPSSPRLNTKFLLEEEHEKTFEFAKSSTFSII